MKKKATKKTKSVPVPSIGGGPGRPTPPKIAKPAK